LEYTNKHSVTRSVGTGQNEWNNKPGTGTQVTSVKPPEGGRPNKH